MIPLEITVSIRGGIQLGPDALAIDGLLAWAVCQRDGIKPALSVEDLVPIEIPVAREPGGRFHLATQAEYVAEAHESSFVNRRFPLEQAQQMGNAKLKRVPLSAGPCKSYRIPVQITHVAGDRLRWWCVGEPQEIFDLLGLVSYLGKKRSTGNGYVRGWLVEPCEPWDEGFPVVRDGKPMRPLPPDWPGLVEPATAVKVLTFPYWNRAAAVMCAVPT